MVYQNDALTNRATQPGLDPVLIKESKKREHRKSELQLCGLPNGPASHFYSEDALTMTSSPSPLPGQKLGRDSPVEATELCIPAVL